MHIENIRRIDVRIHAHRLRRRHEHSFTLDNDDFRFIFCQKESDSANSATFIIRKNVVDVQFVHDLRTIFARLIREHTLLIGAVVFQMITLARWHRVSLKTVLTCRLHIDAPFLPALHNTLGMEHHFFRHRRVLPWAAFHAFADLRDHTRKIVAVAFRKIAHEMVVAAAAIPRAACVCLFSDQHIDALASSCDR